MKTLFLFLAVALSGVEGFAQTNVYHPFPDSNVVWVEATENGAHPPCIIYEDYNLFFNGDTIIGSYTYKKLLKSGHTYSNCPPPGWYYYNQQCKFFRQDSSLKKVFLFINGKDSLLYDFNLNVGDTLASSYINFFGLINVVEKVDSVLIGPSYHKRFWITESNQNNYASIIEGIGSTLGLFNPLDPQGYYPVTTNLLCVQINNKSVFPDSSYNCSLVGIKEVEKNNLPFSISPNPSSGIFTLTSSKNISVIEVSDVLGNCILKSSIKNSSTEIDLSSKPKGIYFLKAQDENGNFGVKKTILQ
jgi:hypothetical protein